MSQQIAHELKALRQVIARLLGPHDPGVEPFSEEHLEKAAKQYQKLLIERGEWVEEYHIDKYIKKAPYRAGRFIREELGFTAYLKRGSQYYYYKEHLIRLAQLLCLERYTLYVERQLELLKTDLFT